LPIFLLSRMLKVQTG